MLLYFIFVFLCSIVHHDYVVHISRVDHWYFCRTWHLITAAIKPIGHRLVFWLVSWQLVTTITLNTVIFCRAVQRVQGEGLHVLLEILALFDLAALPELNDQVSVLADLTFRLKWIVPFLLNSFAAETIGNVNLQISFSFISWHRFVWHSSSYTKYNADRIQTHFCWCFAI